MSIKHVGGNPYFTDNFAKKQKYKSLSSNIDCDVLIVGGGVTGALCSYYFRKNNINTVLIEDNLLGFNSTSICTSILEYEIDVDLINLQNLIGYEEAITCFKLGQNAVYKLEEIINKYNIDCDFKLLPCFYYSKNDKDKDQFIKEFNARKTAGFDVTYIDNTNSKEYFPFDISCGILTNSAASTLHPYKFTVSLIENLYKEGLKVFEKTKLIKTENEDNKVICFTSTGNTIKANKVVICTGYSATNIVNDNIVSFTRTFNIVTSPINSSNELWFENCTIIDNLKPYHYLRVTPDNRIILGGEDITDLDYDENKINNSYNQLQGKLKELFPHLNNYAIDYKYNGIFADSKESIPYIGEHDDFPNYYFCLGYGSNGVLYSTFGAEMLANLYLGKEDPNLSIFKFNRK